MDIKQRYFGVYSEKNTWSIVNCTVWTVEVVYVYLPILPGCDLMANWHISWGIPSATYSPALHPCPQVPRQWCPLLATRLLCLLVAHSAHCVTAATHTVYRCQATVGVCGLGQPPDGHWSSLALSSYPAYFIRGYVPHVGNVSGERSLALALQLAGWIYLWFCPLVIGIYCFRNER